MLGPSRAPSGCPLHVSTLHHDPARKWVPRSAPQLPRLGEVGAFVTPGNGEAEGGLVGQAGFFRRQPTLQCLFLKSPKRHSEADVAAITQPWPCFLASPSLNIWEAEQLEALLHLPGELLAPSSLEMREQGRGLLLLRQAAQPENHRIAPEPGMMSVALMQSLF